MPQDPNDEAASVLLERIKAEKERLIKEKKVKKFELLLVEVEEVPYELPKTWEWTRLEAIGLINPRNDLKDDIEVSFIPMNLVSQVYGEPVKSEIRKWDEIKKGFTHFAEGDVVLAKITPCFQNGKAAIMRGLRNSVGAGTTELHVFRPIKNLLYSEYVLIYLKSPKFVSDAIPKMTGTAGQKRVPNDYFSKNPFPLPPLEEQKRIVAKVDQLMALCDELEERQQKRREGCMRINNGAIAQLLTTHEPDTFTQHWQRIYDNFDLLYSVPENISKLRQAILQLAVQGKLVPQDPNDEPASVLLEKIKAEKEWLIKEKKIRKSELLPLIEVDEIPFGLTNSWEWVRLDSICHHITDGTHHTPTYTVTGVPFLSVKDISSGKINLTNTKYISKEEHQELSKRCKPEFEDVLLTKVGTTGIAKVIDIDVEFSVFVSLALLKFSKHLLSPYYIELAINSPLVKEQSRNNTQGVGNKNLVLKWIKNFALPIPPALEQKRIVAKVDQLMALCDELETKLIQSQTNSEKLIDAAVRQVLVV